MKALIPIALAFGVAVPPALAAEPKTSTLGATPSKNNKLMTRDELRACLKRQEALGPKRDDLEAQRKALDAQKEELMRTNADLKTERAALESKQGAVKDLNDRMRAHGEKVDAWNARVAKANAAGNTGADERAALEKEKAELQQAGSALDAERAALAAQLDGGVKALNAKAEPHDKQVVEWNERNAQLTAQARDAQTEQETWSDDCAGRRYREDDEKAIKAGK